MSLVLVFGVVYVEPRNKVQQVEAALPLAAWAVGALGSIVTDLAIEVGLDFIDDMSKNKWKDKKVGEIWNKYGKELEKYKPTKKNAKEWAMKIPKWLMAAILDEIGDTVEDTVKKDTKRKTTNKQPFNTKSSIEVENIDPLYNTGIGVTIGYDTSTSDRMKGSAFIAEWHDFYIVPVPYEQKSTVYVCTDGLNYSTDRCAYYHVPGGKDVAVKGDQYGYPYVIVDGNAYGMKNDRPNNQSVRYNAFKKSLILLADNNKTVYYSDGVLATVGNQSYFNLPDTIYDGDESREIVYSPETLNQLDEKKYPMIAEREYTFNFGDGSDIIDADFEVINEGDEVDWAIIERDIEQNISNYEQNITYDYEPVINNYYTVSDPNEIKNDIEIIIQNEIKVDNENNNTINGGATGKVEVDIEGPFYCVDKSSKEIVSCKDIEAADGSLLDMAKNAYEFATNTIKTGVESLKSIARTGEDISELFGMFFGWLPSEIRTLIVGGFTFVTGLAVWRAFRR